MVVELDVLLKAWRSSIRVHDFRVSVVVFGLRAFAMAGRRSDAVCVILERKLPEECAGRTKIDVKRK